MMFHPKIKGKKLLANLRKRGPGDRIPLDAGVPSHSVVELGIKYGIPTLLSRKLNEFHTQLLRPQLDRLKHPI